MENIAQNIQLKNLLGGAGHLIHPFTLYASIYGIKDGEEAIDFQLYPLLTNDF